MEQIFLIVHLTHCYNHICLIMNYEQYKEMIKEEINATNEIYGIDIVSGITVLPMEKDEVIKFLSKNGKKVLSPTIYSLFSNLNNIRIKKKIASLYGKKIVTYKNLGSFLIDFFSTWIRKILNIKSSQIKNLVNRKINPP